MNKVILMGRLTRDVEIRNAESDNAVARFSLAVDRRFKKEGEGQNTDFINCVAFGKLAKFLEKYGSRGTKFIVTGRIQTGSYEKDGAKVYTTDVVIDEIEFCESKRSDDVSSREFTNIPNGIDGEVPFM